MDLEESENPMVSVGRPARDADVVAVLRLLEQSDQEVLMLAAREELISTEIAAGLGTTASTLILVLRGKWERIDVT